MTKQTSNHSVVQISAGRRSMLKMGIAGAGCALLPAWSAAVTTALNPTLSVSMGYWRGGGSTAQVASSNDSLIDSLDVSAHRGSFRLRVISAANSVPVTLEAEYMQGAIHGFWQAWEAQGLQQQSAPTSIHWSAQTGRPLPLQVRAGNVVALTQVPAQSGIYALTIGTNGQSLPTWNSLALRANPSSATTDGMYLANRANSTRLNLPYLLFHVEALPA